jgi:dethiobiotin synthetase
MKPVASGAQTTAAGLRNEDAEQLLAASGLSAAYPQVNPYCFAPPIAPHLAARQAGMPIELPRIIDAHRQLAATVDWMVVEGVGGWCVPLGPRLTTVDLARALAWPVVLVVAVRLGCLNHALLTAQAIGQSGLKFAGWVANRCDPHCAEADALIADLTGWLPAPCLGTLPYLDKTAGLDGGPSGDFFNLAGLGEMAS